MWGSIRICPPLGILYTGLAHRAGFEKYKIKIGGGVGEDKDCLQLSDFKDLRMLVGDSNGGSEGSLLPRALRRD